MKDFMAVGSAGEVISYSIPGEGDEWKVEVTDEINDELLPYFGVELTIGDRWGNHEHINFAFAIEDVLNDQKKYAQFREICIQFSAFKNAVNYAYEAFEAAAKKVIDSSPKED